MTNATHTPGPWVLSLNSVKALGWMIGSPSADNGPGTHIGNVYNVADARLIAAAPDLLAALESAEDVLAETDMHLSTLHKVRAAIAKAKGE